MNSFLSLLCIVVSVLFVYACAEDSASDVTWEQWKTKYGKTYSTQSDEDLHLAIWRENLRYVAEHNRNSEATFRLGMNQFSDKAPHKRPVLYTAEDTVVPDNRADSRMRFAPSSWDWRTKGAVTPVYKQGETGDIIAFVLTEEVESYSFIQTGVLRELSIIEAKECCVPVEIISTQTFDCIHNIGGLCIVTSYHDIGTCNNGSCTEYGKINGARVVTSGDEDALKMAVLQVPVMALIDASQATFQEYISGIYNDPECSSTHLDHAVQVVGFGSKDGLDFWICRNSWGVNWGMKGYVWIARNKGNMCGIATSAFYPI